MHRHMFAKLNNKGFKVWKLLDIYVDEARFNQDLSNIDTFGLDETSVAKGHDYIIPFSKIKDINMVK